MRPLSQSYTETLAAEILAPKAWTVHRCRRFCDLLNVVKPLTPIAVLSGSVGGLRRLPRAMKGGPTNFFIPVAADGPERPSKRLRATSQACPSPSQLSLLFLVRDVTSPDMAIKPTAPVDTAVSHGVDSSVKAASVLDPTDESDVVQPRPRKASLHNYFELRRSEPLVDWRSDQCCAHACCETWHGT